LERRSPGVSVTRSPLFGPQLSSLAHSQPQPCSLTRHARQPNPTFQRRGRGICATEKSRKKQHQPQRSQCRIFKTPPTLDQVLYECSSPKPVRSFKNNVGVRVRVRVRVRVWVAHMASVSCGEGRKTGAFSAATKTEGGLAKSGSQTPRRARQHVEAAKQKGMGGGAEVGRLSTTTYERHDVLDHDALGVRASVCAGKCV
jgi:hypothetical protein